MPTAISSQHRQALGGPHFVPHRPAWAVRSHCGCCGAELSATDPLVVVPCHVRAFLGETFQVWRCCGCQTIHCRQIVDLPHYYAAYPFAKAKLTWPFRMFYRQLHARLRGCGFRRGHRLLDYGCGQGLFVKYLRRRGYAHCDGFDPYGDPAKFGDRAALERGPFDFVLLQDVIEHVEDPSSLLAELDGFLKPGGQILVGTPNAAQIDLARPLEFLNELHAPYHLHIYTREAVEQLGRRQGWRPAGFFDRAYHDTLLPGLNTRAGKAYQQLGDGTLDAALEPVVPMRLLTSPRFWWHALSGYWLSQRADMTVVFRKAA